ncbi:hypothetical protein BD408DRAFT_435497 [Parasitella parasitica]|nr:hypothetical protein BD408DRAFT_435497 [Parasitella parasitica]
MTQYDQAMSAATRYVPLQFFCRLKVDQDPSPDLSANANWYDIQAKKNVKTEITSAAQNESIRVHLSIFVAWADGIAEALRVATTLVSSGMQSEFALFSWSKKEIWLPRDGLESPLELQQKIFPDVEMWVHRLSAENDVTYKNSKSAGRFLELKKAILQDARKLDPENRIFEESAAFKHFEAHIKPLLLRPQWFLRETLPLIEQRFSEVLSEVKANNQSYNIICSADCSTIFVYSKHLHK